MSITRIEKGVSRERLWAWDVRRLESFHPRFLEAFLSGLLFLVRDRQDSPNLIFFVCGPSLLSEGCRLAEAKDGCPRESTQQRLRFQRKKFDVREIDHEVADSKP